MKKVIAVSVLGLASGLVSAKDFYGSVAYSMLDSELSAAGSSLDSEPTALNLIGGVSISKNLSVEGVLGLGLSDDDIGSFDAEFELDSLFGVYAVGIIPVSDKFNLYGKLGLVSIEFDDVDSDKSDGVGISYGIGAEARISEQFGAAVEYKVYPDAEYSDNIGIDVETTAIDVRFNFYF